MYCLACKGLMCFLVFVHFAISSCAVLFSTDSSQSLKDMVEQLDNARRVESTNADRLARLEMAVKDKVRLLVSSSSFRFDRWCLHWT